MTSDPINSGMPRAFELERAVGRDRRLDPADRQREARARLDHVELGGDVDRAAQVVGPAAERIGQRQQDAANLLGLLLLERDDVVVDLDGAERLEKQAGAAGGGAVDDAGDRGAVLGADHQHVAAVAIGDDLLLQVLRRVASAQKSVERRPQLRALLPQPIADARQRRRRVVGDVAGRIDLPPDVGDLALERRDALDQRAQQRKRIGELC